MFKQVYWFVPLGLVTLTFSMLMFEQTAGLEQTKYPTSGSYFLLVVPWKFLTVMSEMVRLEGNYYHVSFRTGLGWWEVRAYLVAKSQVLLTVALSNLNRVVDVGNSHAVIRNVLNGTTATSALQIAGESRRSTRPDLDTRTVRSIRHADVVHVDVLDDINFAGVLAQRTDTNTVAAVTDEVLNNDVGAVGLERNTIVAVVDMRVLNHDVIRTVRVPAIRVLSGVLALAAAEDVDVVKDHVGGVGDERVPLRAVSEL